MDSYRRYGPALLRKAERMLQNRDDARDVVQTLFLELLQRGEPTDQLPYLYRAVTNRCLNLMRDRRTQARLLEQSELALRGLSRTTCEDKAVDLDLLLKLVRELDSDHCELLVYRYLDDMSQDEIAELTGISRKTIGKRLARARDAVLRLSDLPLRGEA